MNLLRNNRSRVFLFIASFAFTASAITGCGSINIPGIGGTASDSAAASSSNASSSNGSSESTGTSEESSAAAPTASAPAQTASDSSAAATSEAEDPSSSESSPAAAESSSDSPTDRAEAAASDPHSISIGEITSAPLYTLADTSVSFLSSDYTGYETMRINDAIDIDIPQIWHEDGATVNLVENNVSDPSDASDKGVSAADGSSPDASGTTILILPKDDNGAVTWYAELNFPGSAESFPDSKTDSSYTYDTINGFNHAASTTESGNQTILTSLFSASQTVLCSFTLTDLSGNADQIETNTAYYQNVSESVRTAGTEFRSGRDYTGWHAEQLGDYSFLVKDQWHVFGKDDFSSDMDSCIEYVIVMNGEDDSKDAARMIILNHDADVTDSDDSAEARSATRQQTMESLAESDRQAFLEQIRSSIAADGTTVNSVSFDHVNGAFRVKCDLAGKEELKREDLLFDGNSQYDFGFFSTAKDYSKALGQFTKSVRSFAIPDAAVVHRKQ